MAAGAFANLGNAPVSSTRSLELQASGIVADDASPLIQVNNTDGVSGAVHLWVGLGSLGKADLQPVEIPALSKLLRGQLCPTTRCSARCEMPDSTRQM